MILKQIYIRNDFDLESSYSVCKIHILFSKELYFTPYPHCM